MGICFIISLWIPFQFTDAQEPENYYDTVLDLSGEELKAALHEIIKGHIAFPYTADGTDVWDILKETDRDTANSQNVILFYSGWSVDAAQEYNNGNGWSREQIWALSHGGFGTGKGPGTDVHHIRPVDTSVNSARNNKDYDWGGTLYVDGDGPTSCYSDADSWEPRDCVKGDVARMLFYMTVRYQGQNGEPDLELLDEVNTDELTEPGKGYHGKLSTLLQWHASDPVDSFEIRRNNIIYSWQQNRNPFIDHPEFAGRIWTISGVKDIKERSFRIYPNPAESFITIEAMNEQPAQYRLVTPEGKIIRVGRVTGRSIFSVQDIAPGLYFLHVTGKGETFTQKIIIN